MADKKIKLNKLQNRTLSLLQELAQDPDVAITDETSGEVTIPHMPHAHGDHMHIGRFTVSSRDASGFSNQAVWTSLERKALARGNFPLSITLTKAGLDFETGLLQSMAEESDH